MNMAPFKAGLWLCLGVLVLCLFNGVWLAEYTDGRGERRQTVYEGSLTPAWSPPSEEEIGSYLQRVFPNDPDILDVELISVTHRWESWTWRLLAACVVILLTTIPLTYVDVPFKARWFRKLWGACARVVAGTLVGISTTFVVYLFVGGWGPPIVIVLFGVIWSFVWAVVYLSSPSDEVKGDRNV